MSCMEEATMLLKIGELAKRAALTVRTLHHYDGIGLLSPSARSASGFRLYNQDDVLRLHRILALKQLDCSLADIGALLDENGLAPLEVVTRQIAAVDAQVQRGQRLAKRLRRMRRELEDGRETTIADWLTILEKMTMYEKYFSANELAALRARKDGAGPGLDGAWRALIGEVGAALEQATPAGGAAAQALARRWMHLLDQSVGGDIGRALKVQTMQKNEARLRHISGVSEAMAAWVQEAVAGLRAALFARHMTPDEAARVRLRMLENAAQWPPLIAALRRQMDAGAGLDEAAVQVLARRWEALFHSSYCGEDGALLAKVRAAFHVEPDLSSGIGVDARLIAFVQQAIMYLHRPPEEEAAGPKPSAHMVAVLRAAHQLLDAPLVFEDPLALTILGAAEAEALRASVAAGRYRDPMSTALRTSLVVRSRLAEDEWAAAEEDGVRQYVLLGAGLDTYAYRGAPRHDSRIFEVDLPATQNWKRARLGAAGIAEPAALRYAGIDFDRGTLAAGLADAGFRPDQPAFFAWLGVTMYLEMEDILRTLRCVVAAAAPGSAIVFDFGVDPALLEPAQRTAVQMMSAKAAERGEPWKSYFDPQALAGMLREMGFRQVECYSAAQLSERYLAGRSDGLRMGGVTRLVRAAV
ncbi:SAM-dependent methyltransferase [Janthinobacterium sp.]|uniref:SAM-dependent methyltransferase n=1 Tax=Janthinobacterium sp. TaxID=1871054 RepID=UPI00293D821C|nr:SAM-dependent methyltransferase [Janthinobacterium sp.]